MSAQDGLDLFDGPKVIAFTGHRDCIAQEETLMVLARFHPDATWIHGGAEGFDTQVKQYAEAHGISAMEIKPEYWRFPPELRWRAPLQRNDELVRRADLIIACYDGREKGGTVYTMRAARKARKPVRIICAIALHPQRQTA